MSPVPSRPRPTSGSRCDPTVFDAIARRDSDEGQAQGPTGTGGKLPYFDSNSTVDAAFKAAVLNPSLKPGEVLTPVKSVFGWHVIQVMYRPTDEAHLKTLKEQADKGADFSVLARDNSTATTSGIGGELGWVAKGQLDDALTNAIFATPIGQGFRDRDRRERRDLPVQGVRGGDQDARGPPARGADLDSVLEVVRREEVGGHDHTGRIRPRPRTS